MKRAIGVLSILVLCACATVVPDATGPMDWSTVQDERVPVVVTADPGGEVRETKIWLVVLDGQGFIRTSETRWFKNEERDPNVVLRVGGAAHPLRAKLVMDPELRARINTAFAEKYGYQETIVGWFTDRGDANMLRLVGRE